MGEIIPLLLLALLVWLWRDNLGAKELARHSGKRACHEIDAQFLDDTVELKKLWLTRGPKGSVQICRLYFFDYSSDGNQRTQGRIVMLGHRVWEVQMDAYLT